VGRRHESLILSGCKPGLLAFRSIHRAKSGLCIKPGVLVEGSRRLSTLVSGLRRALLSARHPRMISIAIPKKCTLAIKLVGGRVKGYRFDLGGEQSL
jgi:hypothetical protein